MQMQLRIAHGTKVTCKNKITYAISATSTFAQCHTLPITDSEVIARTYTTSATAATLSSSTCFGRVATTLLYILQKYAVLAVVLVTIYFLLVLADTV
jgi:hypothetical protein